MAMPNWPARLAPMVESTRLPVPALAAPPRPLDVPGLELLVLEAAGRRLAFDILQVAEVAKAPVVTFVPQMPAFVLGVASVRGTLLPIVSLAHVLGLAATDARPAPQVAPIYRVVVLRGAAPIGLAVDRVLQVARLRQQQMMPPKDDAAAHLPWATAFAPLKEGLTAVLSVDALEHLLRSLQAVPATSI